MDIAGYGNNKTKKLCQDIKYARRNLPDNVSEKLHATINFIQNASTLYDVACIPTYRLHPLTGKRNLELAIDLGKKSGYRIIIVPNPIIDSNVHDSDFHSKCKSVKSIIIKEVSNHYE